MLAFSRGRDALAALCDDGSRLKNPKRTVVGCGSPPGVRPSWRPGFRGEESFICRLHRPRGASSKGPCRLAFFHAVTAALFLTLAKARPVHTAHSLGAARVWLATCAGVRGEAWAAPWRSCSGSPRSPCPHLRVSVECHTAMGFEVVGQGPSFTVGKGRQPSCGVRSRGGHRRSPDT